MRRILESMKGRHVDLISTNGSGEMHDRGILIDSDDQVVQLEKDNHQMLIFPLEHVRLIKLLEDH